MTKVINQPGKRRFSRVWAVTVPIVAMLAIAAGPAQAAAVSIHDDSHVLDATKVQNEAASLPDPVEVYTTVKDADDKAAFDQATQARVTAATVVVIAVNTQSHHLAIRTGNSSRITQQAAATATQAFIDTYKSSSDYTAATIAALGSMRSAIPAGAPAGNKPVQHTSSSRSSGGVSIIGLLCLLVVVAGVVVFFLRRRRKTQQAPNQFSGVNTSGGYGQPGYGPGPGYEPGYGSGGYGRSGVSPWVAGGVGAAAGGLIGYELGKEEGREEERDRDERSDFGNNSDNDFGGGGADGDFGGDTGSGSGDF